MNEGDIAAWAAQIDGEPEHWFEAEGRVAICKIEPEKPVALIDWSLDPRCPKCRIRVGALSQEAGTVDLVYVSSMGRHVTWTQWLAFITRAMDVMQRTR